MGHYDHGVAQNPESDEAPLAIITSPIFNRMGHAGEHILCVGEIEPVLAQINATLGLVSRDRH